MSDVNLTVQEGSDVYLSLTETPAVVSVTNPLVAAASFSVTVGTSVTVSNFPATQGISGTVTANVSAVGNAGETIPHGALVIGLEVGGTLERVSNNVPLPVTAVGGVTIGSLPAISGTVTANIGDGAGLIGDGIGTLHELFESGQLAVGVMPPISGTVTASLSSANLSSVTVGVRGSVTVSNFPATQVVSVSNFPSSSSVTIGGFSTSSLPPSTVTVGNTVTINGTVTANAGDFASDYGQDQAPPNRSIAIGWGSDSFSLFQTTGEDAPLPVQIINGTLTPAIVPISGTVTANVTNSVTVGSFPKITWTDYSGSVVTADLAVTAISTITRSYLLAQVTTGQIFLNIGATATSMNSVYFSAGQGFAWETGVPQGIVSIISPVTGSNYVLKDG